MRVFKQVIALTLAFMITLTTLPASVASMVFAGEGDTPEPPAEEPAVVAVAGDYVGQNFDVVWNDNNMENWYGKRPSSDDYINPDNGAKLSFKNSDGEFVELTEENMGEIGMETLPVIPDDVSFTELDDDHWRFSISLPAEYTIGEESFPIEWMLTSEADAEHFIVSEIDGPEAHHTLMYDLVSEYKAQFQWLDNDGLYSSRPDTDALGHKLYRYVTGHEATTLEELDPDAVIFDTELGPDAWGISLDRMPEYTEDGIPYVYYLELNDEKVKAMTAGDDYKPIYENFDNFSNVEDKLFIDGVTTLTLEGMTSYKAHKIWEDGHDAAGRPECTLYLYRIAEGKGGAISDDQIEKAGPVQNHDSEKVDRTKDESDIIIGAELVDESMTDLLPKYDLEGNRYMYFAREVGLTGDYKTVIINDDSVYDEDFETKYEDKGIILNGATIKNSRQGTFSVGGSKVIAAISLQSMTAEVKFQLQKKTENGWEPVVAEDLVNPAEADLDGHVTAVLDGFCAETPGQSCSSPEIKKYVSADGDVGARIDYRWVEVAVSIDGNDFVPVEIVDENEDGTPVYGLVPLGAVGPGVDNDKTTIYCQPSAASLTDTVNRVQGRSQIRITKKWYIEGEDGKLVDVTGDENIVGNKWADFDIYRSNGEVNELYDTVRVDFDDYDSDENIWNYISKPLPRFDKEGREYEYHAFEKETAGWTSDFTMTKHVVDSDNERIPETLYEYVNTQGPGENLEFRVTKEWLDEDDVISRRPVTYGIFSRKTGELVKTADGQDATGVLNEGNEWFNKIVIPKAGDNDSKDNYFVKELKVGKAEVENESDETIISHLSDAGNRPYRDERIIGHVEEGNLSHNVDYNYEVFVTRNTPSVDNLFADYTISNRRYGELSVEMTKSWLAGGSVPEAGFALKRELLQTGGEAVTVKEFALPDFKSDDKDIVINNGKIESGKSTVTISNLEKYDEMGRQYNYSISEVWLSDENNKFEEIGGKRIASVAGDTYVSSVFESRKEIQGPSKHHTGDKYFWSAGNTRSEQNNLNYYKVWRDDGSKIILSARPDIYFDVYRVSVDDETFFGDEDNKGIYDDPAKIAEYCANHKAELFASQKLWNTKWSDWCWSCDIGTVDRYDTKTGNRYIYFLREGYSGGSGSYEENYCNTTDHPNTASDVANTKEVLAIERDKMNDNENGHILILADGYNQVEEEGVNEYYSRTTVNTKYGEKTLHGQKIWEIPSGLTIPSEKWPTVIVEAYRSSEKLPANVGTDADAIRAAVKNGEYGLVKVQETVLEKGQTTFKFTTDMDGNPLARYDEYGRLYNYYMVESEETVMDEYYEQIEQISNSEYHLTNVFSSEKQPKVKVTVNKDWFNDIDDKSMRNATFTLYAQVSENGKPMAGTTPAAMGSFTISPDAGTEATKSFVFDSYTVNGKTEALPYYGPNLEPLIYYVEETMGKGYKTEPIRGYDIDHPVKLTLVPGTEDQYEGSAAFENHYVGETKSETIEKVWKGESNSLGLDNTIYRPQKVKLTLYRKWAAGNGIAAGSEQVPEDQNPAASIVNPVEITPGSDGKWSYKFDKLIKYAPNSKEYDYYVKEEVMLPEDGNYNDFYDSSVDSSNNNKFNNTLKTVKVSIEKKWYSDTAPTTALTDAQIQRLVKMGVLPESMTFTLERSIDGENWSSFGNNNLNVKTIEAKDYAKIINGTYSWSGLPRYDINHNEWQYRVTETLGDLSVTSAADAVHVSGKIFKDKNFKPETADVVTTISSDKKQQNVKFSNTIDMTSFKLNKDWADENNHDNKRPSRVFITISREDFSERYELQFVSGTNEWVLNNVMLPDITDGKWSDTFTVTEDQIGGYSLTDIEWTDSSVTVTNELDDDNRVLIKVSGEKEFKGDKGGILDWDALRPDVEFTLYYLKQGETDKSVADNWVKVDSSNIGVVRPQGGTGDPTQVVTIGADNKGKVEWTGLLKYWTNNTVIGVPEPITYKIVETMKDTDGTVLTKTAYQADSSSSVLDGKTDQTFSYDLGIKNSLVKTSVYAEKDWQDDNYDVERTDIIFNLIANGNKIASYTATSNDQWKHTFTDLPKYDKQGNEIEYSVTEEQVAAYTGSEPAPIEGITNGFSITNTYKYGTVSFGKEALINESCSENPLYPADGTAAFSKTSFGIYKADSDVLVKTASPDADGIVRFDKLRNGRYYVQELEPEAPFIKDDTKHYVTITNGVSSGLEDLDENKQTIINDQVRGEISLVKTSELDSEVVVPGAAYTLYRVVRGDGEEEDEYIEICTRITDDEGRLSFEGLLTGESYVIRETENPEGTYLSKNEVSFDVVLDEETYTAKIENFDGGEGTADIYGEGSDIIWNEPTVVVSIIKLDEEHNPLKGATLEIKDGKKTVERWKTDGEPHVITGVLEAGKTYTLHEARAPKGYLIAKDVKFRVPDDQVGPDEELVIEVEMVDKPQPNTGDDSNLLLPIAALFASLGFTGVVFRIRRRNA